MTSLLSIFKDYMSVYVDDIRLSELAETDFPLWARNMWFYAKAAIPLFNMPPEMVDYLIGDANNPKLTEPKFASATYTVDADTESPLVITLDQSFYNYQYFCVRQRVTAALGNVDYLPANAAYDPEPATITITSDGTIPQGTVYEMDFYTDGYFVNDVSAQMANILGMCFQVVWTDRFNTDWLSNVTKVEDKSFFEQNRSNKMRADTDRLNQVRSKLSEEMRRYEQNLYYGKMVFNKIPIK